jgi:hypothetical protein
LGFLYLTILSEHHNESVRERLIQNEAVMCYSYAQLQHLSESPEEFQDMPQIGSQRPGGDNAAWDVLSTQQTSKWDLILGKE